MNISTILSVAKGYVAKIRRLGGVSEARLISPKGLYSKPIGADAIIVNLGSNNEAVMALQKEVVLEDGDVIVTDNKSYIHFHFGRGDITIKANKVVFDCEEIMHRDKHIDNTHIHTQPHNNEDTTPPKE